MIRLLFADDHSMFRQGLRRLLQDAAAVEIVAECSSGTETLSEISRLQPDVILLDISMPDIDGVAVVTRLRNDHIQIPVIMLTMHDDPVWCRRAITAGANGYLLKDDAFHELLRAIYDVVDGKQYLSRRLAYRDFPTASATSLLSDREVEILKLISQGKTNRRIAEELGISIKTVDTHRTRMMKKLNLHNAAELIRHAVEQGLI